MCKYILAAGSRPLIKTLPIVGLQSKGEEAIPILQKWIGFPVACPITLSLISCLLDLYPHITQRDAEKIIGGANKIKNSK